MANPIPDFTDAELQLLGRTLYERYGRLVPLQQAEAEIQIDPEGEELTTCPAVYWEERGAHFVIFKLGDSRFTAQFFYSEAQQYGTGKDSFDNLGDCTITLLQVQSDHERQMQGIRSGMTATDFDDDYHGPIII
ncbi:MAG: hypothetical protein RBT51_02840 [Ectothiorhodospiraceae bacterium]|jgi:hypothetical protein|nr:hypothetical protein [Ectothiorhodospiraceae bacterium]